MSGFTTNGMTQVNAAAGAQLTGNELMALDTQLANGVQPQSYSASVDQLANYGRSTAVNMTPFRNLLDGGDFGLNPWQRGTAAPGGTITTTVTYTADRWLAFGSLANTNVNVSRQALTAGLYPSITNTLRFGRASGATGIGTCYLGQIIETARMAPVQGMYVLLSFYAQAGAGFPTATGPGVTGPLNVTVISGTGANQSAGTLTQLGGGGWTGQTTINSVAAGVVGAVAQVNVTATTLTKYYVLAKVPAASTELAVLFSYAPLGTAAANEYVEFADVQLEMVSANATQATASSFASSMEKRAPEIELILAQRYFFQLNEGAAGVVAGAGASFTATTGRVIVPFPVQMRAAPTVTTTIGGFLVTNSGGTGQTITTLAAIAASGVNGVSLNITTSGTVTAGNGALLIGAAGTGAIIATADL